MAVFVISSGYAAMKIAPVKKESIHFTDILNIFILAIERLDRKPLLLMSAILVLLWVLSIIDAYQLGKKMSSTSMSPIS
jgi:hypothetical protein